MPRRRCPYGPAHEQPPRDWIPNRSLSSDDDVVVVQIAADPVRPDIADDERHDRQPVELRVAEDLDRRVSRPALDRPADERGLALADGLDADRLLQREDEARPDRFDDGGRAALLAVLDVLEIAMLARVDVGDRAAAGHARDSVAEQLTPRDQDARRPGATDELVRRDEDGVLVRERVCLAERRTVPSRSRHTGRRPRSPRTTAPRGGGAGSRSRRTSLSTPVTFDAAENEPIFSGRSSCSLRAASSRATSIRPSWSSGITTMSASDSRHGSSLLWCSYGPMNTTGRSRGRDVGTKVVSVVEVRREPDLQAVDQPVDGSCRARAREEHDVLGGVRADRVPDDRAGRPRGTAWSGGRCPTTPCGCCRIAAGRPGG